MTFRFLLSILSITFCLYSCTSDPPEATEDSAVIGTIRQPQLSRDLETIRKDGVLTAIAVYNSTSYFLYRGEPMGFEFELLSTRITS